MIRTAIPDDYPFILSLNKENVEVLSPMNEEQIKYFATITELFEVVETDGEPAAFLIAIREGKDYDSENYLWFCEHYSKFLYVDRIVIDSRFRGRGLGKDVYAHVLNHARKTDVSVVTAEIDTEPVYNEVSLRFHKSMGFKEVGTQTIRDGTVKVSLQAAVVD